MKKLILTILMFTFTINTGYAECDFATGISPLPDGSYKYVKECHIKVGEMKRDLDISESQIGGYKKAIELKDLALDASEKRIVLWMDTAYKVEDRFAKVSETQNANYLLYFGIGVATALAAGIMASQFIKR